MRQNFRTVAGNDVTAEIFHKSLRFQRFQIERLQNEIAVLIATVEAFRLLNEVQIIAAGNEFAVILRRDGNANDAALNSVEVYFLRLVFILGFFVFSFGVLVLLLLFRF